MSNLTNLTKTDSGSWTWEIEDTWNETTNRYQTNTNGEGIWIWKTTKGTHQ